MPPPNIWTIHNNPPPNPPIGNDLTGLHIRRTSLGFELTGRNPNHQLATTDASAPPFVFVNVVRDDGIFNITVSNLPPNGANGGGSWETDTGKDPGADPIEGDFTAQAGSGADEDADAASSAYA